MSGASDVSFTTDSLFPDKRVIVADISIGENGRLHIWVDDEELEFPVDWLRHNCQCSECFDPHSLTYISSIKSIAFQDVTLEAVTQIESEVECKFSDGHVTRFASNWLYHRRMTPEGVKERKHCLSLYSRKLWPNSADVTIKSGSYQQVTETSKGFQALAESVIIDGVFLVTDAPPRYLNKEFEEKTGLITVVSHHGRFSTVKTEYPPINFGKLPGYLELHNDDTYMFSCSQIQLLHCIKQSDSGGDNILVDGIKAATILRERFPHHFKVLCTIENRAEELSALKGRPLAYHTNSSPVINLDKYGEPAYIRWTNPSHSAFFDGTPNDYEKYIAAFKEFYKILHEVSITLKIKPGDILVCDNQRLLHGRLAYYPLSEREMEVWYFDWNSLYSKLRVEKITETQAGPF